MTSGCMFHLLYTARAIELRRAGFCVDSWLRKLPADAVVICSVPRRLSIMTGTSRPCQRYSRGPAKLKDGSWTHVSPAVHSERSSCEEQVFVLIAGCTAWRRRCCDLSRTTTFSHHDRHVQALPAVFARTSEAQRWLLDACFTCCTQRSIEL